MRRRLLGTAAGGAVVAMAGAASAADLVGTNWRAETIAGEPVTEGVVSTLSFDDDGNAAGRGGCNSYFGPVEIEGDRIAFGPLAATRMFCGGAADDQETRLFRALESAERFGVDHEGRLLIHSAGTGQPSRFVPAG